MIKIVYASEKLIPSYYDCLKRVAAEKQYLETVEPLPLEKIVEFQTSLISMNGPLYYAIDGETVVGWCDIFPKQNPRQVHRGSLGMGLLAGYRGKGIGKQLLIATLAKAREFGLEKVELTVYTTNTPAIRLYQSCGFTEEGLIRRYRKLDGVTYDGLLMAKFLN